MRPTKAQEERLCQLSGARRFVWNWALGKRKSHYAEHGEGISACELSRQLTALKSQPETAWLKEADSQLLQQSLKDLDTAYRNFFEKRARFPRFKSRKVDEARFRIPQRVKVEDGQVYVPKIGWVRIFQSRDVDCATKSATFKRDACGHWYVTLTAEFEMLDTPLEPVNPEMVIGLDAGLKDFIVSSDGERVEAPKFFRHGQRKLKRAQRQLSKRKKGSKNRDKAKQRVGRVHRQIANQRQDFLHKLSSRLVKDHAGICIEDLNIKGLAKTKLAKSFNDAAHGEFRRQLEYKSVWNRKWMARIDRFFPSSKLHAECGTINTELKLSDRYWLCGCGTMVDRDANAALNIKLEGLHRMAIQARQRRKPVRCWFSGKKVPVLDQEVVAAGQTETENACGAHVRLPLEATGVEARIPCL
jgi:putative transposase